MPTISHDTKETPHGTIAYTFSHVGATLDPPGSPILFIHGNSSSSTIFAPVLEDKLLTSKHWMYFLDLPGHGLSSNSPTPEETYTQPGYAQAIASWLKQMNEPKLMIVGWSLGGHIALELLALAEKGELKEKIMGVMIVGTPPVGPGEVPKGFYTARKPEDEGEHINFAATRDLTDEQIDAFAKGMTGRYEPWLREAVKRTDGRAREIMWTAFEKMEGVSQRKLVAKTTVTTAVVNGKAEPFIDLEFVRSLEYGNLWEGKCHEIENLGHAPFWEDWPTFEPILKRWIVDCEKQSGVKDIEEIHARVMD